MQRSETVDTTVLRGNLLTNLVAGIGDGNWTSRAGVVLNPHVGFTQTAPKVSATSSATALNGATLPFQQYATRSASENILLSPQHFIESSRTLLNDSGNPSVIQNGQINPHLLNLDISASNFTKAMKFHDAQPGDTGGLENGEEDMVDGEVEYQEAPRYQDDDGGSDYEEQSIVSDASNDEQNRLIDRFKQLRQWQVQQQELLMLQQQQQLEVLRGEQEKVQRMMVRQRETALSEGGPHTEPVVSQLPPMSPKKPTAVSAAGKPPQKTGQRPQQLTPPSRPRPNLPSVASTPTEFRENGNPALDSDTASTCTANTHDALHEDVLPLPETAADMNEFLQRKKTLMSHQQNVQAPVQKPSAAASQPSSQFLKHVGGQGDFPRKVLNFDPSETESQPDFSALHDVRGQFSQNNACYNNNKQLNHGSRPPQVLSDRGGGGSESTASSMYTNLLNVPGIMQSLPEEILQQLLLLQQQGNNVVVDANGQLAVLPISLPNGSRQNLGLNSMTTGPMEQANGGLRSHGNQERSLRVNEGHFHQTAPGDMGVMSGHSQSDSPPVHDKDHRRTVENNTLDFKERIEFEDEISDGGENGDDVGSYVGNIVHAQKKVARVNCMDDIESASVGYTEMRDPRRTINDEVSSANYRPQKKDGHRAGHNEVSSADYFLQNKDGHRTIIDEVSSTEYRMHEREAPTTSDGRSHSAEAIHPQNRDGRRTGNVPGSYSGSHMYGKAGENEDNSDTAEHVDDSEEEEEVDEDRVMNSDEEEEAEDGDMKATTTLDEFPVGGLGARKKTFEELLEEELRKEEERVQENVGGSGACVQQKRQFLRKGVGSARYGVDGKPPPRPKPVKRKPGTGSGKASAASAGSAVQKLLSKSGGGGSKGSVRQADKKKQEVGRKTAPLRSKPPDKLQLKPSPKKPPKSAKTGTSQTGEEESRPTTQVQVPPKSGQGVKAPASQKPQLQTSRKPVSSESGSEVGETSFQKRLKYENEELEEFEILEQFADDNVSFLSNLSAVNRAVNQQKMGGAKKSSRVTENEDTIVEDLESDEEVTVAEVTLTEETDYQDLTNKPTDPGITGGTTIDRADTVANNPILAKLKSMKTMQRKIVPLSSERTESAQNDLSGGEGNNLQLSRVEQFSDSDSEAEWKSRGVVKNDATKSVISEKTGHDSHRKVDVMHLDDDSDEDSENEEDNKRGIRTFGMKTKELGKPRGHKQWGSGNIGGGDNNGSMSRVEKVASVYTESSDSKQRSDGEEIAEFGDGEAWEDESKEEDDWDREFLKSKTAAKKAIVKDRVVNGDLRVDPAAEDGRATPPTSKLVSKLFPKLKPDKPKPSKQQTEKLAQVQQTELGDGVQARELREKLVELEREIERFRSENAALERLRKERDEGLDHLKKEMAEFHKQKTDELKRIQDFKAEETRKLKREKKLFEDYQKSIRNMPNKKERDEIEALKQQVSDLQDEMRRKEQRWTSSTTRLRDRLEQLEQENGELKEELKVIEQKRLEAWQQKEALVSSANSASSKGKQTDYLASTADSRGTQKSGRSSTHLKKSTSGPQLSTRTITQINSQLPEPQKLGAALQRDHDLRLSSTAEMMMHHSGDADSEAIRPEDSASNVISNRLSQPQPHPREHTHRLSLKSSTESKESEPMGYQTTAAAAGGKKSLSRKKASGLSLSSVVEKGDGQFEEIQHQDGKVERIYTNGAREILFSNGTRKQVSSDGQSIIVSFFNGDIKQILPDQRVVYYYSEAETTHTTNPDGLEILQFANQQSEKHYPDGTKEITFPDQTVKYLFPNGIEESIFADGTVIRVEKNGDKTMEFPNGQREIHTPQYKRREYPDGTVKTVYPDGRQETRYSSGRIRVKDKEGAIIVDRRV